MGRSNGCSPGPPPRRPSARPSSPPWWRSSRPSPLCLPSPPCAAGVPRRSALPLRSACLGPSSSFSVPCSTACRSTCYNRSEEHTSELQSLMRISYAVFCLKKKKTKQHSKTNHNITTRQKQEIHTQKHVRRLTS